MSTAKYYDAAREYGAAASRFAKSQEVNMSPMLKTAILMFLIVSVLIISPFRMMTTVGAAIKDASDKTSEKYKAGKMIKDMYTAVGSLAVVALVMAMMLSVPAAAVHRSKILVGVAVLMLINVLLLAVVMSKIEKAEMKDAVDKPARTDFALTLVLMLLMGKLYMENK